MSGDAFTDYEGPLSTSMHLWCFVCAQKADFGIRVKGRLRTVGACKEHIRYVESYRAVGAPEARVEVNTSKGKAPEVVKPKKTLGETINEVETYYAKKEGRDPDDI